MSKKEAINDEIISFKIPGEVLETLDAIAKDELRNRSSLVRKILHDFVDDYDKKKKKK